MSKKTFITVRVSDLNKNWLELERMMRKEKTLDEALTAIRKDFMLGRKKNDYVFRL